MVESGASRLSRIDLSTGEVTVIMEDLEFFTGGLGEPPTWGFDGVAVGPSGHLCFGWRTKCHLPHFSRIKLI